MSQKIKIKTFNFPQLLKLVKRSALNISIFLNLPSMKRQVKEGEKDIAADVIDSNLFKNIFDHTKDGKGEKKLGVKLCE